MVRTARGRLAQAISVRVETLAARQQVQIAEALANIDRLVNGAFRLVEQRVRRGYCDEDVVRTITSNM